MFNILNVEYVGKDPDNCATYFLTLGTKQKVAKITHPKNQDVTWYYTSEGWEPETQITNRTMVEIGLW